MKRRIAVLCLALLLVPAFIFSQDLGGWRAAYGDWKLVDGRLVQASTRAGMAQAVLALPQSGIVQYEFDVKYVDGGQDFYGGFGFHVGIDKAARGKSWGNGKSFLLWLTLDPKAYGGSGVFAQAYASESSSEMAMAHDAKAFQIPASRLKDINLDKMSMYSLPVKIRIDYDTGVVKVWDPLVANYYYRFSLGGPVKNGAYVAVRTNSLAASFGNFKISRPAVF